MPAKHIRAVLLRAAAGRGPSVADLSGVPAAMRRRVADRAVWLMELYEAGMPTRARNEAEASTAEILISKATPPTSVSVSVPVGVAEFIEALLRAE